jgi:RimJ/RimL family protein N-acetyltransferase
MTPIRTERLILRNWEERDRPLFYRINTDERVMKFFPFRRDRARSDALMDRLRAGIRQRGYGFSAVEIAATGDCMGFVGLHPTTIESGSTEIGWRLAPEYWGFGYATEAAQALLSFGFETVGLAEVISFAVWNNHRSTAVMRRLGMRADPAADFDHPDIPETHPQLKRHVMYRLSRSDWRSR